MEAHNAPTEARKPALIATIVAVAPDPHYDSMCRFEFVLEDDPEVAMIAMVSTITQPLAAFLVESNTIQDDAFKMMCVAINEGTAKPGDVFRSY